MAALSRAPEAVGRNAQGGPPHAMLSEVLHLSVGRRLALGAPLDYGSDTGVSGDLRIALRMSLSAEFVRYGRRSERCRVVDYGHVCRSREDAGSAST